MNPVSLERTTEERIELIRRTIEKLLASNEVWRVTRVLDSVHPADAADLVENLPEEEQQRVYEVWEPGHSAKALQEMEESEQLDLAERLSVEALAGIMDEMSPDDAADLLGDLSATRRFLIIQAMNPERATEVHRLLTHRADTAGGLMTPRIIALDAGITVSQAIERLREIGPEAEDVYYIFVTDEIGRLAGVLSLRNLIVAQPHARIKNVMDEKVFFAQVDTDREEVIRMMRKYNLSALPVVDQDHRLAGMVTFDDAFEAFEDEATEDIYRFAGTVEAAEGDVMSGRLVAAARARLPWVAIALIGETLIVGAIAQQFNEFLLVKLPILIFFLSAMQNLGGNISTQAATIIVRGFATGQLDVRNVGVRVFRELKLGLFMGVLIAVSMGGMAFLLSRGSLAIGVVIGIASIAVIIGGALVGTIVPIFSHRVGIDPAVTTPLLTVTMDASSVLIYFGVGLILLQLPVGGG